MASLIVVLISAALAALVRARTATGVLGKREAYGRPMSDWAAVSVFGLGLGLAVLAAGYSSVAFLILGAVLIESYVTVSQIRPRRRR
ncbi:MAG: hypothetical protein ACRD0C_10550 [Acidimicrobiia bacterium]